VLSCAPEHPEPAHTPMKTAKPSDDRNRAREGCMSFQRNTTRDAHDALE
jgi:hypothetical protein